MRWLLVLVPFVVTAIACSGEVGAIGAASRVVPVVDAIDPIEGAADRGADPAVVAIEANGTTLCAGVLVAPDAVLALRECVARPAAPCMRGGPPAFVAVEGLSVSAGDDATAGGPRSGVRDVAMAQVGDGCGPGVALLLLDTPIDAVVPLGLRATGAAQGDRVRTVGLEERQARSAPALEKVVRDHVRVTAAGSTSFVLDETPGRPASGRAVLDENAMIVGLVAGPAPADAGAADYALRTESLVPFVASELAGPTRSSGGAARLRTRKGAIDLGADCEGAIDCAASVCVSAGPRRYCSRSCASDDRCPPRWRCQAGTSAGASVHVCTAM